MFGWSSEVMIPLARFAHHTTLSRWHLCKSTNDHLLLVSTPSFVGVSLLDVLPLRLSLDSEASLEASLFFSFFDLFGERDLLRLPILKVEI